MNVRGHHLACMYCFLGSGKTAATDFFGVDNAIPHLLQRLQRDPETEITVVATLDDVCQVCPLATADGCGRSADARGQNEKLCGWDRSILAALDLRDGETITARALEQRIRARIPDVRVHCPNCSSSSPSGWAEYRNGIRRGLWVDERRPGNTSSASRVEGVSR